MNPNIPQAMVELSEVVVDAIQFQLRVEGLDKEHVERLRLVLQANVALPPVAVFQLGGKTVLVDGFHRYEAHRLEKKKYILVERHNGTSKDARAYARKSLLEHQYGLAPSKATLMALLADVRKNEGANWSYGKLAAYMGFKSHNTAKAWLGELVKNDKLPASALEVESVESTDGKNRKVANIGGSRKTGSVVGDTATPQQAAHAEQIELAKQRLAAKKNTLLKQGIMDAQDNELFFFDEVSEDPTDTRLRNRRTGEVIGGPQKMPALQILEAKQAESDGEKRALEAAERREGKDPVNIPKGGLYLSSTSSDSRGTIVLVFSESFDGKTPIFNLNVWRDNTRVAIFEFQQKDAEQVADWFLLRLGYEKNVVDKVP